MSNKKKKNVEKNEEVKKKEETKEEKLVFKSSEEEKPKEKDKKEEKKADSEKKEEKKAPQTSKQPEEPKEENLKDDRKKKKVLIFIIIVMSILVVILIFSTIFTLLHSRKNTIASGVKIKNIDVSGMTYEDAKSKLDKIFKNIMKSNIDLVYGDDYKYTITAEDVELSYDFKDTLDEAYSIGRTGNVFKANYNLLSSALFKKNIDVKYSYNEKNIASIIDEVSASIPGVVTQYSHYIEGDNLIITPGKDGVQVDKDKLKYLIAENLINRNPLTEGKTEKIKIPYNQVKANEIDIDKIYEEVHTEPKDAYFEPATETEKAKIYADVDGIDFAISIDEAKEKLKEDLEEYVIPITRKKANVTINDIGLEAFPNKLQEFSTTYDASNWGRSENLRIATSKIDGTVLMPNQQFSFNGVVGERTVQEGYKNAAIYEGDSVVDGLAGGICQVSSTLYNAALLANLKIDERYNHSFKPTYVNAGRDATVVYGVKDFKFTNTRSYPIKIEGSAANGVITFSIYGIEEDVEYKINIISTVNSTIPFDVQTVQDNSLAPGAQQVVQLGATGYKSTTYKETVLNGTIISKEVISNDTYKAMARIIHVGPQITPVLTPPVETAQPQAQTPATEQTPTPVPAPETRSRNTTN